MTLLLARSAYDDLVAHAREAAPAEACGVLAGARDVGRAPGEATPGGGDADATPGGRGAPPTDGDRPPTDRAVAAHRTANVAETPRVAYELDPEELYAVVERLEDAGREVVGFYHSHPAGPPRPSATDVAQATWTGHHYAIVALDGVPFLGTWRWTEAGFVGERVALGGEG